MLYELLTTLEQTPGLKDKELLLRAHKDTEEVKRMLTLALNPKINFYTTTVPAHEHEPMRVTTWDHILGMLEDVIKTAPRGAALTHTLRDIVERCTAAQYLVVSRIVKRDLRCNVGVTITNKVWPKLIPEHPYMGCKSDTKKNRAALKIEKGSIAQEKCDGMYCDIIIPDDNLDITIKTRQGSVLDMSNAGPFTDDVEQLPVGVWMGELRVYSHKDAEFLPRHIGNGIIRTALDGGTLELPPDTEVVFTCWDYVPYQEWLDGKSHHTYLHRFQLVTSLLEDFKYTALRPVVYAPVNDWAAADTFYQSILAKGGEGAVCKRLDCLWKDGKPSYQVKMKVEESADMLVVGTVAHTKTLHLIGALEVTSSDGKLSACCGGLMQEAMEQPDDYWVGKVIRMKYNALSPYGRFDHPRVDNGSPSVWDACVRSEGSKPNSSVEIKENYARAIGAE